LRLRTIICAAVATALVVSTAPPAEAGRHHAANAGRQTARIIKSVKTPKIAEARECLARAMYFESERGSEDGMLAVGTVVANRLQSGRYGPTICGVVGQRLQFAPGVLTRRMTEKRPAELARRVADDVLAGRRHAGAGDATFFHTANVKFRNDDKAYVLIAGGNAFYGWNRSGGAESNLASLARATAAANVDRAATQAIVAAVRGPASAPADTLARSAPVVVASASKPALRVITPSAPVLASFGPVFRTKAPGLFALDRPSAAPMAAILVAQAWAPFDGQQDSPSGTGSLRSRS
jgi:spore germination cell wall hydrolase CwlJ-like protein